MKNITKILFGAAGAFGVAYGVWTAIDELLFNKNLVLPQEVGAKFSGCDMSHLRELLTNNLKWVEDYGYEKHYIMSDRGEGLVGYLMKAKEPSNIYVFGAHGYRSYGKKDGVTGEGNHHRRTTQQLLSIARIFKIMFVDKLHKLIAYHALLQRVLLVEDSS